MVRSIGFDFDYRDNIAYKFIESIGPEKFINCMEKYTPEFYPVIAIYFNRFMIAAGFDEEIPTLASGLPPDGHGDLEKPHAPDLPHVDLYVRQPRTVEAIGAGSPAERLAVRRAQHVCKRAQLSDGSYAA